MKSIDGMMDRALICRDGKEIAVEELPPEDLAELRGQLISRLEQEAGLVCSSLTKD